MITVLVLLMLLVVPAHAAEEPTLLSGTITHVRDGDTFEVGGIPVRLAALDCPENKTTEGKLITQYAKRYLGSHAVCQLTGAMSYDRVVGYCTINDEDYGSIMMQNTTCKLWAKFDVFNRYRND
jgi:endonuclease YncB( thermonuclease family)